MKNKDRILVTSALPYANGPIHIGHLVEYIQTDIYVRFMKLKDENIIYCCADDTHGAPVEINASKQGMTPEEFIAKWYEVHQVDFDLYNIKFDSYYTTNSEENRYYTELIYNRLNERGYIYTKEIELTYCENCNRYLPDRYVKGTCPKCGAEDQYGDVCEKCNSTYSTTDLVDPYCSICNNTPIRRNSEHYFFKLSDFTDKLEKWLKGNDKLQDEIRNQILNWVKEGLDDWCISRDGPYFGFKIPGEEDKYFYVWLDAPIGYIASTANYCKDKPFTADDIWQSQEGRIQHFIGKDIIYFHLLFWPAVLMGSDFHVPDNVVVHGFLTVNGEKMSKSRGTFLTAQEFAEYLEPELLRYYYASNLSHTMTDIDLDLNNLRDRINNELVSNLANLVYRTLRFTNRNFESKISTTLDKELLNKVQEKCQNVHDSYNGYNYRDALREILEISSLGNKYFQDNAPWEMVKTDKIQAQRVLTDCFNIVKNLVILIKPVLPLYAEKIEKQLNLPYQKWGDLGKTIENHKIGESKIVLKKIESIELKPREELVKKGVLNLKVAKVTEIHDHPNGDNLYVMKIDIGSEQRQICAGLKPYYPNPDDLLGKHLVVVCNMKPAKLRGEISEAMLLAAQSGDIVGILTANNTPPGTQVTIEGVNEYSEDEITFPEFQKVDLQAKNGKPYWDNKVLVTDVEEVSVEKIKDGVIR